MVSLQISLFPFYRSGSIIFFLAVGAVSGQMSISRTMYNNMARLVGEEEYPATWWEERKQCLALISTSLTDRQILHSRDRGLFRGVPLSAVLHLMP